jgi:predicted metal-dependent enzyme (double-stranded beta helix superfamily)
MLRPGASRDAKRNRREGAVFELERFTEECRAAVRADPTHRATREVVARAVSDPAGVLAGLGEPCRAEVQKLYHAPDLTILNVVWAPGMTVRPHNHLMWAVIGIYTGRENNIWWRRLPADAGARIEAAGAKSLGERETEPLGRDIIHTVTNPLDRLTGAIHVYGGDFFATPRSEWDPETLVEAPFDVQTTMRLFEEANTAYEARMRAS